MTQQNAWRPPRPGAYGRDPKLRAGDRDRDAVAEMLRTQHAAGRLDTEELQQRIDRCYEAKTLGQLEEIVADLPRDSQADERSGWHRDRRRWRLLTLVPVVVTLAAVCALTGRHLVWLTVPLIFLTARLRSARHWAWRSWGASRPRDHWG
jgi:hypothetical protein